MKRGDRRQPGKGAIELIEEATHLLRSAPGPTLVGYYVGALPFVLALLYFWSDMSRSPAADQHLPGAALGVAVLFVWMKFRQAIFARHLRALISGDSLQSLQPREWCRILIAQTALQPTGFLLLPLSLFVVLPFASAWAFYQNLTVLADGDSTRLRPLIKRAATQAALWPAQNVVLLLALFGFGFYVFLNWSTAVFLLPGLVKTLFGAESTFARSGSNMLNTTFFAAMLGLTYLCIDPIIKAAYALRCFYGESLNSGADLKAELKRFAFPASQLIPCLVLGLMIAAAPVYGVEPKAPGEPVSNPQPSPSRISSAELDHSIQEVIQQPKYTWRMPRGKLEPAASDKGVIARFLESVRKMLVRWIKAIGDWLSEWLRKFFRRRSEDASTTSGYGWIVSLQLLFYGLVAGVVIALGIFIYRVWSGRLPKAVPLASDAIQPAPDLADENIGADQLPEDGWTRLARELFERGELRLALRAFYLASLAHLAGRNLITLAKFKSNRDYELELRRRGHSLPLLLTAFGDNVLVFDRIWYGVHEVNAPLVSQFADNVERIRAGQ
jgi:hypothetical protein